MARFTSSVERTFVTCSAIAARQISPVEKSTGDVIVYIEGRRGYIIGHYRRSLKIILYSQAFC
jgi:hypothetical protein